MQRFAVGQRRQGGRFFSPAFLGLLMVGCIMLGCGAAPTQRVGGEPPASLPSRTPTVAPLATLTQTGTPTSTPSPTPTATASSTATATPTQTAVPTHTPTPTLPPTATPIPTPSNLPPPPRGWRWQHVAEAIQITHYITAEILPAADGAPVEQPYAPDNQPLAGVGPLPRLFLLQVAYQGSGRLPDGNLLEYAGTHAPAIVDGVPFRYVVTSTAACGGYPKAANLSCSIPYETAATTYVAGEPLIPVGSTIFIVELNLRVYVNDTAGETDRHKIDLYTGYTDSYDFDRPDGSAIWLLVPLADS